MIKLRAKFDKNGTICGEVIDDLAHFSCVTSRCDLDLRLRPLDLEC